MSYCSPKQRGKENTCFDDSLLDKIVDEYNKHHPDNMIDTKLTSVEKVKLISKALKRETGCTEEWCLAKSETLSKYSDDIQKTFRPPVPSKWNQKKNTWLNTLDLIESLSQYEEAYPDFDFISVSPIDFDTIIRRNWTDNGGTCVDNNLCSLSLAKERKTRKTKFGAVFNLDKHYQSGSHWVSFYTDSLIGESYYYDSVANNVPDEVVQLMERITHEGNELLLHNQIKLNQASLDKRFNFTLDSKNILPGNSLVFPLDELCRWLVRDDNFMMYRFSNFRNRDLSIWENREFNITPNERLTQKVIKQILELVDLTEKYRYVRIPNLDTLIENKSRNVDEFSMNWVDKQIGLSINNYMASIELVSLDNQNAVIKSININGDGKVIIELELNGELKPGMKFRDISFKMFKNYIQHQFENTECGMYSINFIDSMLTSGKTYHEIIRDAINDTKMNSLRYSKYFRPSE